jgi:hypothetical protein
MADGLTSEPHNQKREHVLKLLGHLAEPSLEQTCGTCIHMCLAGLHLLHKQANVSMRLCLVVVSSYPMKLSIHHHHYPGDPWLPSAVLLDGACS